MKPRGDAAVVAGSLVGAVARSRAKARLGHIGGLTENCGVPDDGAGVPASDEHLNHVREVRNGQGVHTEKEWPTMALWFLCYLEVDLLGSEEERGSRCSLGANEQAWVRWRGRVE